MFLIWYSFVGLLYGILYGLKDIFVVLGYEIIWGL